MAKADWTDRGEYMLHRHGIRPEWADEALSDPDAVVLDPDPGSKSGRSVRTIGWSFSAEKVITVITLEHEGTLYGVNGWEANRSDQRLYREET